MTTDGTETSRSLSGPRFYVPGYATWKLALSVCGLIVFCLGCSQLWPPLRLVLFGQRAEAVATRIITTKPGSPDVTVSDDQRESVQRGPQHDDSIFWNEFSFLTAAGRSITVRDNVGSRLRPLYPLVDADGLPTTALVCYDARRPATAVFPGEFSTWLVPLGLALVGLACAVISAVLLSWAGKPIEMPEIVPS